MHARMRCFILFGRQFATDSFIRIVRSFFFIFIAQTVCCLMIINKFSLINARREIVVHENQRGAFAVTTNQFID